MVKDLMRYDTMVDGALRGVMIEALGRAATAGLPGDHHFYIEFDTRHAGVRLPAALFAQHPETMTLVLQHQFCDLTVPRAQVTVCRPFSGIRPARPFPLAPSSGSPHPSTPLPPPSILAFSGIRHALTVPFDAVVGFADPSVDFRLQFKTGAAAVPQAAGGDPAAAPGGETPTPEDETPAAGADHGSAEVVTLDAFRKK